MFQYILTQSEKWPVAELAQMAVEGGCTWITLHLPEYTDEQLKTEVLPEIVEMCREEGVILTVDDRPETARELGLHGVRLSLDWMARHAGESAATMREKLGPEAVIGIECADPSAVPALVGADIDFAYCTLAGASRREFARKVREAGVELPLVAQGDFALEDLAGIIAEGYSGVAMGAPVTEAGDPVTATGTILDKLS